MGLGTNGLHTHLTTRPDTGEHIATGFCPFPVHAVYWTRFHSHSRTVWICHKHLQIQVGTRDTRLSLSVQFLSFSFSFLQKSCQMIGFQPKLRGCPPWKILDPPLIRLSVAWSTGLLSQCFGYNVGCEPKLEVDSINFLRFFWIFFLNVLNADL